MNSSMALPILKSLRVLALVALLACVCGAVRAAPTFQAAGTEQSGTGNVTVDWPAHQVGDVALLFIESTGGQAANLATANGFVAVTNSPQANGTGTNGTRLTVYWARATSAAMASPVVTDPGDHLYARILTYRGVIQTGNPWDVTGGGTQGTGTTVTVTGVTTTVADTLVVQAASRDNDSAAAAFSNQTNGNLTGIVERSDAGTTSGNGGGIGIWDGVKATAGATGNTTATVTNSANAFLTIALRPATSWYSRASTGWATTSTWSTTGCGGPSVGATPPAGSDVVICAGNTVTLDTNSANLGSLTVQATGTLLIGDSATNRTLTVAGDISNGGTLQFNNNNGDHNIGAGGDFVNSGVFGHINNTSGGVRTTTIAGNLTNSGVFEFGGRTNGANIMSVTVTGNVVNTGTIDVDANSNTTHTFAIRGNVTNNGTFDMFTDANSLVTVTFNGTAAQTISGSAANSNFHNLILNNANGLSLSGTQSITVNTTLTLTSGRLATDDNVVYVASGNAVGGAGASNFVVGNLRKRFPVGTALTRNFEVGSTVGGIRYAPVSITLAAVTTGGDVTVTTIAGDHPGIAGSTVNPALSINRYWTIDNSGVVFTALAGNSASFTYVAADFDSGAAFASFIASRYNPPLWTEIAPSARTATTTTISGAGITSANLSGEYQVGQQAATSPTCTTVLSGGLNGDYFNTMNLSGSVVGTRVDGPVDFDWANANPGVTGVNADQFSVRWTGLLRVTVTGNYQFQTNSDDGVRLWVNNALIIDNWTDHSATDNTSANVALTAGQLYNIRMEFYENGGQAVAKLRWLVPSTGAFVAIPSGPTPAGAGLYTCGAQVPGLSAHYTMDQGSWNGTAGEVTDISGNSRNGTAVGGVSTAGTAPAVTGSPGTCRYGVFDGTNDYVTVANLSSILNGTASMTFWIKTTQTGNDTGWMAPGVTGVEQSGGADDMFWGWLDAGGRIGLSVGNDFTTKSTVAINNGAWRHIALTRDHVAGTYKIYVDGALNASGAIAAGLIGTPWTSIGRIEDTGGTPEYFNGQLDEVRIYDRVLTDAEVASIRNSTRACASVINHYYVQHAANGVNCQAENVTITAHDVAHAAINAGGQTITITAVRVAGAAGNRGDYSIVSGTGVLINGTADDGVATYAFGAGETAVTLAFKDTWVQTVNFTVDDGSASDTSGTASADANYNQNLAFSQSGFRFIDAANNAISSQVQTAGVNSAANTFFLQAIESSSCTANGACTGVCTGAFPNGGNVSIGLASKCVNPTTCISGQQVRINGTAIGNYNNAAAIGAYTPVTLNFGANSTAPFTFNYTDVGQMTLAASYTIPLGTGAASSNTITGSSAAFVVKPFGFAISGIQTTAGAGANPAATDATGGVFIKAGNAFTATVTAIASGGAATPNYGREISPETFRLASTLVAPSGGNNPAIGNPTAFGTISGGAATGTTFSWGEVGIITLAASVGDGDYLGAGNVTGAASGNIGRFTPDHFDVSLNAPMFDRFCGTFTYIGQPFFYSTGLAPVATVTARNLAGGTTLNYQGTSPASQAWWKITNASLTGKAYTAAVGTLDASGLPGTDPVIVSSGNGVGTLTFGSGTGLSFVRSTEVAPFDADISLAINVIDADNVAYASNPARFGQAAAGNGILFSNSNSKQMRFGRLKIGNAYGSEMLALPVPLEIQYYNGTTYVTSDDSCTTLSASNFSLSSGSATVSGFAGGKATLRIPKPGTKTAIDICADLDGSSPSDTTCTAATPANTSWLKWKWSGSAFDRDPRARATFGIYKNADDFIYLREMY